VRLALSEISTPATSFAEDVAAYEETSARAAAAGRSLIAQS
jgi:hypothetical protein